MEAKFSSLYIWRSSKYIFRMKTQDLQIFTSYWSINTHMLQSKHIKLEQTGNRKGVEL